MAENILKENSEIQFDSDKIVKLYVSKPQMTEQTTRIIELVSSVYNPEIYSEGIRGLANIPEYQYPLLVQPIYYLIWITPVFKKQIDLITSILDNSPRIFHSLLFHHVVVNFDSISTDRKDKFFFLLKKIFPLMSFSYILGIQNYQVLGYLLEQITSKEIFLDWSDSLFLEFLSTCKPFLCTSVQKIKIDEQLVRKYLDRTTNPKNRDALYSLFKESS